MASILVPMVAPELQGAHFYIVPSLTLIKLNDVFIGKNQTTDITMSITVKKGKLFLFVNNNFKHFKKRLS